MTTSPNIWLYNVVGYTTDFRTFLKDLNVKLEEFQTEGKINVFDSKDNIWSWVGNNCYGNYAKDEVILKNFQNIIINYDEMSGIVTAQVYSCSDKYKANNEEFFAKEIMCTIADLLSEPDHWVVAFAGGSSKKPLNYYVRKCSVPSTPEDFTIDESMYDTKIDDFNKEIPLINGYKSMLELVSSSGSSLANSLDLDASNINEFIKNVMATMDAEGPKSINAIQEPYQFFELEFKPIDATVMLARDGGQYMTSLKGYNSTNVYATVPEATFDKVPPRADHPTVSIVYSRDNVDFIKTSCEIEKEVLGEEIENQLKVNNINSVDDFFS